MIIANPIYDVVFKYLLEDTEIARDLLATILGVKITKLDVHPQETLVQDETAGMKIFHLDFKAVIELAGGGQRTVLIELQKAKKSSDILRFRKYLGKNYQKAEARFDAKGEKELYAIEIVSIYMLGYKLVGVDVPVLKVGRTYTDAITEKEVVAKNEFIQKLTHESYTIQIPLLTPNHRNQLEEVLEVFIQDNFIENTQQMDFKGPAKNPLVKKMVRRLSKAAADEKLRESLEAEDLFDIFYGQDIREKLSEQAEQFEGQLREKDGVLREKDEILREKDEVLREKDEVLKLKELENEDLKRQLEALKTQLKK